MTIVNVDGGGGGGGGGTCMHACTLNEHQKKTLTVANDSRQDVAEIMGYFKDAVDACRDKGAYTIDMAHPPA